MKAKRILSAVSATAMALGSAAGLSVFAQAAPIETLNFYTDRDDLVNSGAFDEIVKPFEEANNCDIKFMCPEGDTYLDRNLKEQIKNGTSGIDVIVPINIRNADVGDYFEPLGKVSDLQEKYYDADTISYDGIAYGLPFECEAPGFYYNTKVWEDAGITTLPITEDEFIADLEKIADSGVTPFPDFDSAENWAMNAMCGMVVGSYETANFKNDVLIKGVDPLSEDGPYYKFYKLLYKLYHNEKNVLSSEEMFWEAANWDGSTTDPMSVTYAMATDKLGVFPINGFAIPLVKEKAAENGNTDFSYKKMPIPMSYDGKQYATVGSNYGLSVTKSSSNKDLAKKFVTWLVDNTDYSEAAGCLNAQKNSKLTSVYSDYENVIFRDYVPTPDELSGTFQKLDHKEAQTNIESVLWKVGGTLGLYVIDRPSEEEFNAVIENEREKWKIAYSYNEDIANYIKTHGKTYAPTVSGADNDYDFNRILKGIEVNDKNAAFEDGVVMNVKAGENTEDAFSFNITFTKDGKEVQPSGKVTVKVPLTEALNGGDVYVYHGKKYIESTRDGDYVVFETDSFSPFKISNKKSLDPGVTGEPESKPESSIETSDNSTSDGNPNTGIALAIAPVVLAGAAVVVLKKKH